MPAFVAPEVVTDPRECFFYHSMDIPDHGFVLGACDMRSSVSHVVDPVDFKNKRVIEIGPASGFYSFEMEKRGADVVSVELSPFSNWDYLAHDGVDPVQRHVRFQEHLALLRNSYWFNHGKFRSKARIVHGTAYELDTMGLAAEIGVINAVLLHLRDPMLAIERLAAVTSETIIISDAEPFTESRSKSLFRIISRQVPFSMFIGDQKNPANDHTWWHISPKLVKKVVEIFGFKNTKTTFFQADYRGKTVHHWAVVAKRS